MSRYSLLCVCVGVAVGTAACKSREIMVPVKTMADALHLVLETDRTVYTQTVVARLSSEGVVKASEQWEDQKALPLPAQMFRLGAEKAKQVAQQRNIKFSYKLLSEWPINPRNKPQTDIERRGLEHVKNNPNNPFYDSEESGGTRYFYAVYADKAISSACVDCHNGHNDSPKKDFRLGDVMGGVVLTIPVN